MTRTTGSSGRGPERRGYERHRPSMRRASARSRKDLGRKGRRGEVAVTVKVFVAMCMHIDASASVVGTGLASMSIIEVGGDAVRRAAEAKAAMSTQRSVG